MPLTYLHFNYGRTTTSGAHPDWRRDTDTVTHLTGWRHKASDLLGWGSKDYAVAEPGKAIRRIVQVPIGVAATTYLTVFIERGAYLLKWYGANVLKARFQQFGPGYIHIDRTVAGNFPTAYAVDGEYFAAGVNTRFSGDDTVNSADPNQGTGFTAGDIPTPAETSPNTNSYFAMSAGDTRRIWVPRLMKIGFAAFTATGDLAIETAG